MLVALALAYGGLFGTFVVAAAVLTPVYAISEIRERRRARRLS
jgi:hypothetical protein